MRAGFVSQVLSDGIHGPFGTHRFTLNGPWCYGPSLAAS